MIMQPAYHFSIVCCIHVGTNIANILLIIVKQVFQKGPQVTALVAGTPRSQAPARTPSNPCIAASDRYTTDEEQPQDSRRSTDIDEVNNVCVIQSVLLLMLLCITDETV